MKKLLLTAVLGMLAFSSSTLEAKLQQYEIIDAYSLCVKLYAEDLKSIDSETVKAINESCMNLVKKLEENSK